jgi:hypothetical protein
MSRTTIQAVWPGERHENIEELRNSHGSAPVVWNQMAVAHLGLEPFHYSFHDAKLWPLWKRMDIPKHQRAVLTITYDNAYIAKANFKRAASDIRAFLNDFPQSCEYINHWPRIVDFLESDPDYPAVAFWWTSVCCDPLRGEYDEELGDYGDFEWGRLWEVYEALDNLDKPESRADQNK